MGGLRVFNNIRGSVLMAILLHGTMDVFPNAFLLAHLPGAAGMTGAGVLSMYWGLALGFGLFALLLVIFTRGRLGSRTDPGEGSANAAWAARDPQPGALDFGSCRAMIVPRYAHG